MDENKVIKASEIIMDPEGIATLTNQYIIVNDTSSTGSFSNLVEAINLLADHGWTPIQMTDGEEPEIRVLFRNENYKTKNQQSAP